MSSNGQGSFSVRAEVGSSQTNKSLAIEDDFGCALRQLSEQGVSSAIHYDYKHAPLRDTKGTRVVHRRGAIFSAASFDEITGKTSNSTMSLHFAIH